MGDAVEREVVDEIEDALKDLETVLPRRYAAPIKAKVRRHLLARILELKEALAASRREAVRLKSELRSERERLLGELWDADKITTEVYEQAMDELAALKDSQ